MSSKDTKTLILLHTAVFLAGWTGIFGRLISLGGLPLVWYRIMVSVAVLALHWVAFFASIQASNVSIGVACMLRPGNCQPLLPIWF